VPAFSAMSMKAFSLSLALAVAVTAGSAFAQAPRLEFPAPSPACTIKQRVGLTDIEVVYSRPSAKGRTIFSADGVVPFGRVWRTGANAATKITFSTPVKLNGTDVAAGSYALYTIPGADEWTIILNKGVGKSGTQYDEKEDVVRFKSTPVRLTDTSIETFTIEFNHIREDSAVLDLIWEKTVAPIKIEMDVTSKVLAQIPGAMSAEGGRKPYYQAAAFYYDHDQDLQKAKEWVEEAIKQNEAYYVVHLKAKILAKLGDKEGATKAANRSIELAKTANDPAYVKLNQDLLASLK
jgi:hypothetical protein